MKGPTEADTFGTLRRIVSEQRLIGDNGSIRGGFRCICFTEAPESTFHQLSGRYRPFGIKVSKRWLFAQGGRPVIYQRGEEYERLSEDLRWRHVRYEPDTDPPIDFSWEREWRIHVNELFLPPEEVAVVVPHEQYAVELQDEHFYNEHMRVTFLRTAWGELAAFETEQPFAYELTVLPQG
jgi:hypothetical protein